MFPWPFAAAAALIPPGHEVHAVWPVDGWNVPSAHKEQALADAAE